MIVKYNVATESQPAVFVVVNVLVPDVVYVTPFQVNELHAVVVKLPFVELWRMVNVSVAVFKHPAAFKLVNVYSPLTVYVAPFQT